MGHYLLTVFLFVNCASLVFSADDSEWDYDSDGAKGPKHWKGYCKTGNKQSPINIESANAIHDKNLGAFTLTKYNTLPSINFTVENDGHTLKVAFPDGDYRVSKGGLTDVYKTVQFHFHWGSTNTKGSEHEINGKQYAAEFHFVSYNTKYANISEAVGKGDGLAVLGVFIEVEGNNNTAFSFLQNAKGFSMGNMTYIPAFNLFNLLPANKTNYFRYNGSLTIPKCNEVVTWTVFKDPVKISQYQIGLLRSLKKKDGSQLEDNFRPVQPLNDRTVKASFPVDKPEKPAAGASAVSITAGLFLSMLFAAISVY